MRKKDKRALISFIVLLIIGVYYFYTDNISKSNNKDVQYKTQETTKITSDDKLNVSFIDVGQADSILIQNNGESMLIDAGNNEDGDKLVNYFNSIGISEFKYVVGTHAHEDHIGGMDNVIENFKIDNFYMPDVITTTATFEDVLDALDSKSVAFQTPEVDSTFNLGDASIRVIYVGSDGSDLNDSSIVLKLVYGENSFLFTGDATSKVEKTILNKDINSDVLKVGHHGSNYSSTTEFLKAVNPKYAVISVGVNNTYRHPADSTLSKLKELGTKVYRTDDSGTVIASSDGKNITFQTMNTDTNG